MTGRGHDAGAVCACSSEHRPPILEYELHHVVPLSHGGPDTPENRVWLCPSGHTNCHEIWRLMLKVGRRLSYVEVQAAEDRPVSRHAYAVAARGWDEWTAMQHQSEPA